MRTTLLITAGVCITAAGCANNKEPAPAGSDTYMDTDTGPPVSSALAPSIDEVGWGCDPDGYFFEIYTTGVSSGGWLAIYQTGAKVPWNEEHSIEVYTVADDESHTRLYRDLPSRFGNSTPSPDEVANSTLYSCDENRMQDTLTFVASIDDTSGATVECTVWGHAPDAVPADDCSRLLTYEASRIP